MVAGLATAGVNPVAEDAVIAGIGVIDVPAAPVRFAPVVGAVIIVIALSVYEADAAAHLFRAVKPLGGAGIFDMLAHAEQANVILGAKLVILAGLV
jgi:hypothetical protein